MITITPEEKRLEEALTHQAHWRRWGPYLSDRFRTCSNQSGLQKFHHYLGDEFKVECPTGSGNWMALWQVASELSQRLM